MTNRGDCSFFCLKPLFQTARRDNLAFIEFAKLCALRAFAPYPPHLHVLCALITGFTRFFLRASKSL